MKTGVAALITIILLLSSVARAQHRWENPMDSTIAYFVEKINPDSIQAYMQALEDFGTRFCLADNRREVSEWIQDKFIGFGYTQTRLDSFEFNRNFMGQLYETWQYNVVATLPGYLYPERVYIMGGHHDAITTPSVSNPFIFAPGADDNASGTAAALEVARVMKQYNYEPESTIKFITFAAEELGLHGSWHYANTAFSQGMDIRLMINNDMISNSTLPQSEWIVKLFKYPNALWVADLANYIIQNFTVLGVNEFTHTSANTDSWPFHARGYPAIFFHENEFSPFYHSVNDLVINTNKYYCAELTRISIGMLIHENGLGLNTGLNELSGSESPNRMKIFPNPFSGRTNISYTLNTAALVDVRIYDAANREISILINSWEPSGTHRIEFNADGLAPGIYFCRLHAGEHIQVIKLIISNH